MKESFRIEDARILVLDDEPANILLLQMILEDEGFSNILALLDPMKALEQFDEFRPDIVLLDLHMPVLSGFDVMERLRARVNADEFLPILVLTADISPDVKRRALSVGASDFVTKPFDVEEVALRVRNLLTTRYSHLRIKNQKAILEGLVSERTAELLRAYKNLQAANYETLERLAIAGEFRDDDTGHHTARVGKHAATLAEILQLPPEHLELYRRAAPLHDIGKIGISDTILLKPGKLTDEEFDTMKTHTTIGASILSGGTSPLLQLAEEITISHHERWDGSGYPAGLAGDSIPLSGRIVSVCDVFDALTHERPYKKAWPAAEAIEEIRRQSGKQFDPAVVAAFLALWEGDTGGDVLSKIVATPPEG